MDTFHGASYLGLVTLLQFSATLGFTFFVFINFAAMDMKAVKEEIAEEEEEEDDDVPGRWFKVTIKNQQFIVLLDMFLCGPKCKTVINFV